MLQKRYFLIFGVVASLGFVSPALADCAQDLDQVNAAMETTSLSDADKAKVEELKAVAMEKQSAGDDSGCQADLVMAKTILQLE